MNVAVLIGIAVAVAAALVILSRFSQTRRSQDLARVAAEHGFHFEGDSVPFSDPEILGMPRFNRSRGGGARNVMRGTASGMEFVVFDHTARGQHGGARETVAAFRTAAPEFELMTLRHGVNPKVMTPVFARLGYTVMCFDSHPEFCRDYLLLARDETSVRGLFTPALLRFLDQLDKAKRWAVESGSGWLLICESGHRARPQDLLAFLEESARLAASIAGAGSVAARA